MGFWETRHVVVTEGHGFLGSFVVDKLRAAGAKEVIHAAKTTIYESKPKLFGCYTDTRPDIVIHLAAVVGGIGTNRENPGRFFLRQRDDGIERDRSRAYHGTREICLRRNDLLLSKIYSRSIS
jgi:hypothetical protein